ncbi:MAG: D-TA family PLP-dependent enzyme [Tannerellaceae bacterium]|jgi:D-serine deaminase-like pyridoxal phosphate-dependent protein|nr:D-TA family PLP-dependent enzyme [Tannerellaceae bacterium]
MTSNLLPSEYVISNIDCIDSPALVVYEDIVRDNIRKAIAIVGDVDRLRPHVKTHKMEAVCRIMIEEGIKRYKCATIAEAEMLAVAGARDVLLAYQPVGPKVARLRKLTETFPRTVFSCLVDNADSLGFINRAFDGVAPLNVFIDVNVGMNRTGAGVATSLLLAEMIPLAENLRLVGLHGYDGHIHDNSLSARRQAADKASLILDQVYYAIRRSHYFRLTRIIGGTPTFPIHALRPDVECSPGTFVFWDAGYARAYLEMPFRYAAMVIGRVVSHADGNRMCVDIGYKSVASENPLPRIYFLNDPTIFPLEHSEEHLMVDAGCRGIFPIGTVLYGVPTHICPTVALYEKAFVVRNNLFLDTWPVTARNRFLNI